MDSQVHRVESMRHKSFVFVSHRKQVGQLVERASNQPDTNRFAMLFLLSYAFLLRLPSEAIPVTAHTGDCSLKKEGMFLVLSLKRRKNKPGGSRLVRGCWCRESKQTCPVHVLGPYLANCRPGERLFLGITSAVALSTLRLSLQSIGVARGQITAELVNRDLDDEPGLAGRLRSSRLLALPVAPCHESGKHKKCQHKADC